MRLTRAPAHVHARAHNFNVPNDVEAASAKPYRSRRPPHPGAKKRRSRQGRLRRPRHRQGRGAHRVPRRTHHLGAGAGPPPARSVATRPHLLLPRRRRLGAGRQRGRQRGALDQPRLLAQLHRRRAGRPHLHQGTQGHQGRRRAVLRLRPRDRRTLHAGAEEALRMPLRHARLPRHDAVPETLGIRERPGAPPSPPTTPMFEPQAPPRHPTPPPRPHWGAEALWQAMVPLLPGLSIEVVQTLDSTNSELTDRLRNAGRVQQDRRGGRIGDLAPQMLVAINQTAGRGRLGRRWHATPGSSLTFSLALPLLREDWSGLSLAVGLAVAEALDPQGTRIGLKWPNDLILSVPDAD